MSVKIDDLLLAKLRGRDLLQTEPQITWRGPINRFVISRRRDEHHPSIGIYLDWSARWIKKQPWWVIFDDEPVPESIGILLCTFDLEQFRECLNVDLTSQIKLPDSRNVKTVILPPGDNLKLKDCELRRID